MVVYETDDSDFADSAIDALQEADVDCYRTGGPLHLAQSNPMVCIHIRNGAHFQRANQILIRAGAAVERPQRLPSEQTAWAFIALVFNRRAADLDKCWRVARPLRLAFHRRECPDRKGPKALDLDRHRKKLGPMFRYVTKPT